MSIGAEPKQPPTPGQDAPRSAALANLFRAHFPTSARKRDGDGEKKSAISPFCQCAFPMMASHKADKIQFVQRKAAICAFLQRLRRAKTLRQLRHAARMTPTFE